MYGMVWYVLYGMVWYVRRFGMVWYGTVCMYVCMHVGRFRGIIWGPIPWGGGNTGHGTIYIYIQLYAIYMITSYIWLYYCIWLIWQCMIIIIYIYVIIHDYAWLYWFFTYHIGGFNHIEKYVSQWEGWHPICEMENKSHVPNHQPGSNVYI